MSLSVLSEARKWSGVPECGNNAKKPNARTQYLPPRLSSAHPHKALGLILCISKLCLRKTSIPDVESMINLLKIRSFLFISSPQFIYFKILMYLALFFFFDQGAHMLLDTRKLNLKLVSYVFTIRISLM